MIEITAKVDGKKVPIDKLGDVMIDQIQQMVIQSAIEQVKERINTLDVDQKLLNEVKVSLNFQGEQMGLNIEGPEEIQAQILELFEEED